MANPKFAALSEREAQKRVVKELETQLDPGSGFARSAKTNPDHLRKRLKEEQSRLQEISPPQVDSDDKREYVTKRLKILEQAMVHGAPEAGLTPMPTYQEMWEPRDGMVGKHRSWEMGVKEFNVDPETGKLVRVAGTSHRGMWAEWKDLRRSLYQDKEEYDPDVANIEVIRPDKRTPAAESGRSVFSNPLSKTSWAEYDRIMGGMKSYSDVQIKIREAEELGDVHVPSVEEIYAQPPKKTRGGIKKFICGALTTEGEICKNPVPQAGSRCRWHEIPEEEVNDGAGQD